MQKRALPNGCFLTYFMTFNSNHVVVSGLRSVGTISIIGRWGSNPWWDLIGFNFSILGWCGSNPMVVTCSVIFQNSQTPNLRMCLGPYVWHTLNITLAIHIHSLVIQICLGGEPMDSSPKVYDLSHPLTGWNREFEYSTVAYQYNLQDILALPHVRRIHMF